MARKPDNMPKRNKKNFRPTKSGAGMTEAGVRAYRRKNQKQTKDCCYRQSQSWKQGCK